MASKAQKIADALHNVLVSDDPPSAIMQSIESAVIRAVQPQTPGERKAVVQAVRATVCIIALDTYLEQHGVPVWPPYVPPTPRGE